MKRITHILTLGDKLLMGALLMMGIFSLWVYPGRRAPGTFGVIESGRNVVRRLDLSRDREVSVSGPIGETIVEVKDGRIRVKQSPCPHQLCVRMGFRERDKDVIACVPNRVVVRIEGGVRPNTVNGVTR